MIQLMPMTYNFHIALIDSSHTVVDPNGLLAATDSVPSTLDVIKAVGGALLGGFSECTGLETSLEVEDYKEGGLNDRVRKFPTRVTWSNIVLKSGIGFFDTLWNWHADYMQGKGKRRDGVIVLETTCTCRLRCGSLLAGYPLSMQDPLLTLRRATSPSNPSTSFMKASP